MQMMRVLEPQDQTSALVIRVIKEVLVPVGKYILALRLLLSHCIYVMNGMLKSLSLYLIKQLISAYMCFDVDTLGKLIKRPFFYFHSL